ncbi:MAG: hypothetical protein PHY42_06655, partial [Bacilli bacterium]|nr:hypothetical protein [Bacilli bacterium]
MKKQIFILIVTIVSVLSILAIILGDTLGEKTINAVDGVSDFSSSKLDDFNNLNGEWEVYYDELIVTHGVDIALAPHEIVSLPTQYWWGRSEAKFVSYRLVLENFPQNEDFVVGIEGSVEGYAIYINRNLAFTNHNLHDTSGLIPLGEVETAYKNTESNLEIIVEISSFYNGFSGLTKAPSVTSLYSYSKGLLLNASLKAVIIGVLLFIALYQFIVVGLRSKETGAIFFSLMAIAGAIQVAFYHNRYGFLFARLSYIPEQVSLYIHQIGMHLATLFFYLILFSFYNPRTRKMNTFETILLIFPIALFMTIIFTPVQIFTS